MDGSCSAIGIECWVGGILGLYAYSGCLHALLVPIASATIIYLNHDSHAPRGVNN